jgi:hypothetical protein
VVRGDAEARALGAASWHGRKRIGRRALQLGESIIAAAKQRWRRTSLYLMMAERIALDRLHEG